MLKQLNENMLMDFNKAVLGTVYAKPSLGSVFSGVLYYDKIEWQIAAIINGIINNHPFLDGNKRTAVITLLYISEKYNIKVVDDDLLFSGIVKIASTKLDIYSISKLLFV